ncbi:unannotated protein [freshwater metagenome]|uniref:Unannotated protein n=1 Tax=freshwater metagenome TaxID=449393 RepID=A0A6J7GFI4_9ZZZZ
MPILLRGVVARTGPRDETSEFTGNADLSEWVVDIPANK